MARSQYIYLLMDGETIVAAFTVKHEAITALKKLEEDPNPNVYPAIYRIRDNGKLHAPLEWITTDPA